MDEQNTDVNTEFKNRLIRHMDRISSITISTKDDPVLFTFLEEGGCNQIILYNENIQNQFDLELPKLFHSCC